MGVRPHVVIVGAGFGGLAVARGLDKLPVEVTLVDRENFTTFQPLLYQVATAGLNAADVAHPIRGLFHRQRNLHVERAEVVGVDWDAPSAPSRRRARSCRSTTSWSPSARWRPGSACPAPSSTPRRCTRSRTPFGCGTTCSNASSRPTPTTSSSTPASSTSSSWAAGRPESRPPGRWPSCSASCSSGTTRRSASDGPGSCWSRPATRCSARSTTRRGGPRSTPCGPARSRSASTRPWPRSRPTTCGSPRARCCPRAR